MRDVLDDAGRGAQCHEEGRILLSNLLEVLLVVFFSSRRRHTRFKCDWSSDVCSSDLPLIGRQLWGEGSSRMISRAGFDINGRSSTKGFGIEVANQNREARQMGDQRRQRGDRKSVV